MLITSCVEFSKFSLLKLKNSSNFNILWDTPNVKYSTCYQIYSRKASLYQSPTLIMIMNDVPERKFSIAPPARIEFNPVSSFSKPKNILQSTLLLLVVLIVMSYFCHHKINKLLTHLKIQVSYVLFGLLLPMKSLGIELYHLT